MIKKIEGRITSHSLGKCLWKSLRNGWRM